MLMRISHQCLPPKGLAVLPAMAAKGFGRGGWSVIAPFAHKARPIMHHPEVVDHCALILSLFPAPGAVGHPIQVA